MSWFLSTTGMRVNGYIALCFVCRYQLIGMFVTLVKCWRMCLGMLPFCCPVFTLHLSDFSPELQQTMEFTLSSRLEFLVLFATESTTHRAEQLYLLEELSALHLLSQSEYFKTCFLFSLIMSLSEIFILWLQDAIKGTKTWVSGKMCDLAGMWVMIRSFKSVYSI